MRSVDDFIPMYTEFLDKSYVPDVVIATPWPFLSVIARSALNNFVKPCKVISFMHGPLEIYKMHGTGGAECLGFADCNFVLNMKTKKQLDTLLPNIPNIVVDNPVDFSRCADFTKYTSGTNTLLFVGRLSEEKKLDTVINALSKTNEIWKLRIVGDGDNRTELENLTRSLNLTDRVEFLGWKENPWEYAYGASALILSSEYEGFPLVEVEAMSSGLPVISTPVDGISELIVPGVNGYLFKKNDPSDLAQILDLISSGALPAVNPKVCHDMVAKHDKAIALESIENEITNVLDTISVIIPCYNVADKISRCLDSIINQTITSVKLEIICVDDKSTDNTLDILKEYEQKYPDNIILIPLEENGKQGRARNIALSYASGNYITYIDSDDYIHPDMLNVLYSRIKKLDCDVIECGYKLMYPNDDESLIQNGKACQLDFSKTEDKQWYLLNRGWKTAPWGRLYKREIIKDNDLLFPEGIFMEDIYFSEKLMSHMNSYAYIPTSYYYYVVNNNGTMASDRIISYYMDTAKVQNMAIEEVILSGRFEDSMEELAYLYFSKAFAEPVSRMWENKTFFSYENYCYARENVLKYFPNIAHNKYISASKENGMILSLALIKSSISNEAELYKAMNYLD